MGDQIFKKITNEELAALTNSQFHKIKILDIIFDCRSHISEYVQIYIAFNGVDVQDPVLELIDNYVFNFDNSMSAEHVSNKNIQKFILFTSVVYAAQKYINQGHIIEGLLTKDYVSAKCTKLSYVLDETTDRDNKWHLYTNYGVKFNSYSSLAALNYRLNIEIAGLN